MTHWGRITKKAGINLVVLLLLVLTFVLGSIVQTQAEPKSRKVSILFTSDLHSHLNSFHTSFEGEETNIGGLARIKTIIDKQREKDPETLLVDGGDFSMGTLFQTVYKQEAVELRMLGYLGYDATTFGNHEFDFRSVGLSQMLETSVGSKENLPSILICNVDWSEMNDEKELLQSAFDDYGVKKYEVIEKNGVKIAILGVFGEDALACAPTCALTFEDPIEAVKNTVADIKENEDVDMIVCLSHSGVSEIKSKSEDEALAQAVPELDLIISGHSHTFLEDPILYGDTAIVACGEYGECVGSFTMQEAKDGRWTVENYKLIPTTEDVTADTATQEKIDGFAESIDEEYLAQYAYTSDQVIVHNNDTFSSIEDLYDIHTEHNLGDIIADAYAYAVENAEGYDGVPVDVAVVPSGTIRDTYVQGNLTVTDIFRSFSLGIGPDGIAGYPLISIYMTGKELKTVAEIDASVSDYMPSARLYCSGLNFTYNPNRLLLNRVTDVYLLDADGNRVELEDDKLYRVVADLYSGQMLSAVTDMSYGLLSLVPKDADGKPINDFEDAIIYDGSQELKAWVGIAKYMGSFKKNADGVPEIPEYYNEMHDRKVVDDDKSIGSLLQNPNKYAAMIIGAAVVAIVIIVLVIVLLVKVIKMVIKKRVSRK